RVVAAVDERAGLDAGADADTARASDRGASAGGRTRATRAFAGNAGTAGLTVACTTVAGARPVGDAVAVVVHAVADLGGRHAHVAGALTRATVVDPAVTVVVGGVARIAVRAALGRANRGTAVVDEAVRDVVVGVVRSG